MTKYAVYVTPAEARALLHATNNSLADDDFRRDHMTATERRLADDLATKLGLVARERAPEDRRGEERREVARRQEVDETSPLRRTPKLRRVKVKRRYYKRRG